MYRPFRVLIVDDDLVEMLDHQYRRDTDAEAGTALSATQKSKKGFAWVLWELLRLHQESKGSFEVYVTGSLAFDETPAGRVRALGGDKPPALRADNEVTSFLSTLDVLLLDLGGVGPAREEFKVAEGELPEASEEERNEINELWPGAGFYLRLRDKALLGCQAVIVLTVFDSSGGGEQTPPLIKKYLDPLCDAVDIAPWTTKRCSGNPGDLRAVVASIREMFEDFSSGYTTLHSRGSIEFAATHDRPVLIVGETGTGKEYIAGAIHRRWCQERTRRGAPGADCFQVVNCAGLSEQMARSELFGHVKYSFTGAEDHRLGKVFTACGLQSFRGKRGAQGKTKVIACWDNLRKMFDEFDRMQAAQGAEAAKEYWYKNAYQVHEALGRDFPRSLFAEIDPIVAAIQKRAGGGDYVAEYLTLLKVNNPDRVEQSRSGNLTLSGEGPFGTVFLDEFGDLPGPVQAMVLRWLQRPYEIEPLGFPGSIQNARVRIIAATSDSRVAKLAGAEDFRGWPRSTTEIFRPDLFWRVGGHQRIRAEPVTKTNARMVIERTVGRHKVPTWKPAAIGTLTELVELTLEDCDPTRARAGQTMELSAFGHYRQVDQFVELVNDYVREAANRGVKAVGESVTAEVVKRLWRPSTIVAIEAGAPAAAGLARGAPVEAWEIADFRQAAANPDKPDGLLFDPNSAEFKLLEYGLARHGNKIEGHEICKYLTSLEQPGWSDDPKAMEGQLRGVLSRLRKKVNKTSPLSGWKAGRQGLQLEKMLP